jgi:hypothetical protein
MSAALKVFKNTVASIILLCLHHIEGEVVVLAPHNISDLLCIGRLIIVGVQVYYCCVIGKLDGVGVVPGHAVKMNMEYRRGLSTHP